MANDHQTNTLAGLLKAWLGSHPTANATVRQKAASLLDDLTGDADHDLKAQLGSFVAKAMQRGA